MSINKEIEDMKAVLAALEAKALLNIFESETIWFQGFEYKTFQSPTTGRIWQDRNLGASEVDAYGGYFTFGEANCPEGYEVPSDEEWSKELPNNLNTDVAWMNLPLAGYRTTDGGFVLRGDYTSLWSSTESDGYAYSRYLYTSFAAVDRGASSRALGCSVRLIKKEG